MSPEFKPNTPEDNHESIDQTTIFKKDSEGYLLNITNKERIPPHWKEIIETVKEVGLETLGENVISIYVSGSVARGVPDEKNSDLDMFAIVREPVPEEEQRNISETIQTRLGADIKKKVGFHMFPLTKILGDASSSRRQFLVKLLSMPIYGEDFRDMLPEFKANKETARILCEDIAARIEKSKEQLRVIDDEEIIKLIGRKLMKKFIRQGFYPIMIDKEIYTSSSETASILFAQAYPEKAELMQKAYEICKEPTGDKEKILAVVDALGPWLIEEAKKLQEK
jgi:predicted nucleotidyltransferase